MMQVLQIRAGLSGNHHVSLSNSHQRGETISSPCAQSLSVEESVDNTGALINTISILLGTHLFFANLHRYVNFPSS